MVMDAIIKYWVTWAMGLLAAGIVYLWKQGQKAKCMQKAIQDGVRALLRDRIIQMYMICKSKGYCTLQERENLEILYVTYHAGLNGNGTVTDIYNNMREMPQERKTEDGR